MKIRILNRGPLISNRLALLAILALTLTAFAGYAGNAEETTATAEAQVTKAEPTRTVAGKDAFRLLLLRRG